MTRYTPLWQQDGQYAATEDRRLIGALWPAAAVSGLAVSAQGGGMIVNVAAGMAAVPAPDQTGALLCASDSTEQLELGLPGSGGTQNRIDLVALQLSGTELGLAGAPGFDFVAITGTPATSPVAPALPRGALRLAQVYLAGGSVSIAPANITDLRPASGLAAGDPRIPHTSGAVNPGSTLAWIQNGWGNWPAGTGNQVSIPFTKYRADTVLRVFCSTTGYIGTSNAGRVQIGFRIGTGADRPVVAKWLTVNALQPREMLAGEIVVPGIAPGALTVNMRASWPGSAAGDSLNFGTNEFAAMTVSEDYA